MLSLSLFVHIAAAVMADLTQPLSVALSATHVNMTASTAGIVPSTYIVALCCETAGGCGSAPHAKFYQYLRSRGIIWTTTKEYRSAILHGTVIRLHDPTDYDKLAGAAGIESISPVQFASTTTSPMHHGSTLHKRAHGVPWSHTVTGVDRLHSNGYFGRGVTIGVINGGIDYTHRLLGGGIGPGHKTVGGWDFVGDAFTGRENSPGPQSSRNPMDVVGHGTHVAGIIGAEPDLQRGIVGVAYEARMNAYRVAGRTSIYRNDIILDGFIRAHEDGNNIIVLAVYIPGGWGRTPLALAVDRIAAMGRVVVVAAGNMGQNGPWMTTDLGSHEGVISVGNIENVFPSMPVPHGLGMHDTSSQGPSNSLHMSPVISAPGTNIHSTWPVSLGEYQVQSGSSQAAAFVAGATALWLQARGRSSENALLARSMFINTALPVSRLSTPGNPIETVLWQGAGLIQVHTAATSSAIMTTTVHSAEMMINDTLHAHLAWTVRITNNGRRTVTYTVTHEPAGTTRTMGGIGPIREPMFSARPILTEFDLSAGPAVLINRPSIADISTDEFAVRPGRYKAVTVRFQPPAGVQPATFPVYSGYLKATGSDGSVLRSVYLGLAASMSQAQVLHNWAASLGLGVPCLANRRGSLVPEGHVFNVVGINAPTLIFRLAFGSPWIRIDLINARAIRPTYRRRSINPTHTVRQKMAARSAVFKRASFKSLFGYGRASSDRGGSSRGGSGRGGSGRGGSGRGRSSHGRSHGRSRGWGWGSGRGTPSRSASWDIGGSSRGGGTGGGGADPTPIVGTLLEQECLPRHPQSGTPTDTASYLLIGPMFADGSQIPDGFYRVLLRALKPFGDSRSIQDYKRWTSPSFYIRRT